VIGIVGSSAIAAGEVDGDVAGGWEEKTAQQAGKSDNLSGSRRSAEYALPGRKL